MPPYVDFSWKAESHPLSTAQIEEWESIIRAALGGSGWVVMRQVHGVWHVEEARLADPRAESEPGDRRNAVREALRQHGKTVGG